MLTQNFKVIPDGHIVDGHLSYSFNEKTGDVSYSGSASVKIMFFTKSFDLPAKTDKVDPKTFLSSNFQHVGDKLKMGDFNLVVTSVSGHQVNCALTFKDYKGVAIVDNGAQYVRIVSVSAFGNVPVIGSVHLMLQAV